MTTMSMLFETHVLFSLSLILMSSTILLYTYHKTDKTSILIMGTLTYLELQAIILLKTNPILLLPEALILTMIIIQVAQTKNNKWTLILGIEALTYILTVTLLHINYGGAFGLLFSITVYLWYYNNKETFKKPTPWDKKISD